MREIPAAMRAKLDEGAGTFCACWRIDPKGGAPLGFTDHDEDIEFDDLCYEALSGFAASAIERSLGLAIDNASASGALRSDRIDEADIRRGRYDGAEIRIWMVDWSDPRSRLLTFRGELGEITRGALAFEVELRGLSERLNRPVGRRYLHVCDARLGDGRCGFDASGPAFRGEGVVGAVTDRNRFEASGLSGYATDWFAEGELTWTSGANAGALVRVRTHVKAGMTVSLEVASDPVDAPATGDSFSIVVGCDKRFATCRRKFQNVGNFRGFPHIPGENWLTAYPTEGGVHDGGSRNG
ncbi:MAG: DUF2163 domain-containing protein [Pikeienuella sp.]